MVTRYGMSERLGSVAYDRDPRSFLTGPNLPSPQHEQDYGEETAATIDDEVRKIVQSTMSRALVILREKRDALERIARCLLEKETLEEKDLTELLRPSQRAAAEERSRARCAPTASTRASRRSAAGNPVRKSRLVLPCSSIPTALFSGHPLGKRCRAAW